jgi:hypothetical protein
MNVATARLAFIVLAAALSLQAQTPGPSVEQHKSWVVTRQQRVDLLRDELKQTDARIESRLDLIIETLTSIGDSKDSRRKVARMKEDTMKRLLKTIEFYDQKRALMRPELRNPKTWLTQEEKKTIVAMFDVRIEKRTRQILALNKSMPTHEDYERHKAADGALSRTENERNQDFEQNRRLTSHTKAQRDALVKQLDSSLVFLDRLGGALRSQLAATTDPTQQKEREVEIAKNDALIAERRQQKLEVLNPSDHATRQIALEEATDLDQALKKSIDELQRDFTMLFARYNSLVTALTELHATEATLAEKLAR